MKFMYIEVFLKRAFKIKKITIFNKARHVQNILIKIIINGKNPN